MFVVVRSRGCSPATVARVRACLDANGACVEAEGAVTISTLLCTTVVARFFGGTHYWGACATEAALRRPFSQHAAFCTAEEDVKSCFYVHFGELWDAALDAGRLRTALDVLQQDGIGADNLAAACAMAVDVDSEAVLTLPTGLTITRLPSGSSATDGHMQPPQYVANGTYPAQLAAFQETHDEVDVGEVEAEEPGCWWCAVSSPTLGSRQEQAQLAGQLADAVADLQCLDVITAPLQALAARVCWAGVPLRDDPFARTLVRHGVPLAAVEALVRGPTLHEQGRFTDVFDLVADQNAAEVAQTLADLWATVRCAAADADRDVAAVLYDWETGRVDVAALDSAAAEAREHGVVLVHPRVGVSSALTQRLKAFLVEQQPEVRLEAARDDVTAAELHAKLDLHHGDVARYALDQEALRRLAADEAGDVAAAVQRGFQEAFDLSWDAAMQEGRLWSTALAEDMLGEALTETLLKLCASGTSATSTHALSPALAVTEVPRETLWTALNPLCPVEALTPPSSSSTAASSQGANRLTAASYFIVNAAYGVYRRDVMAAAGAAQEHIGAVWQLSWPTGALPPDVEAWCQEAAAAAVSATTGSAEGEEAEREAQADAAEPDVMADYEASTAKAVCVAFPLLHLTSGVFAALRGRHLWWGTPFDDDVVSRAVLEATGQSWAAEAGAAAAAEADAHEAVLALLPPVAATEDVISLVCATLEGSGVTLVESVDLFAQDAFEYVSSGSTELAIARRLAQESGTALWDLMSEELQVAFIEAAMTLAGRSAPAFSPHRLYGGCVVCTALRVPPFVLEEGWRATPPVYVAEGCWLGYLAALEVWVVNGHIAIMQQYYEETAARVHLLRLRWAASASAWNTMRDALVGPDTTSEVPSREEDLNDLSTSAEPTSNAGAVARLFAHLAERAGKTGTSAAALLAGEPTYVFSSTAFHGLVDVLRWPGRGRSGPLSSEVATEDWLLRRALVRQVLERGASSMSLVVQQVREALETVLPLPLVPPPADTTGLAAATAVLQPTPAWTSRFTRSQRDAVLHHGFLWLHPSSSTPAVRGAIPELLMTHRVRVRASGVAQLDTALDGERLEVKHDAFYKNAYVRSAAEVPITDAEAQGFVKHFAQSWVTAVQLGLVLNAKEAEQRFGTVPVTRWWDTLASDHQVKLSDSLYVGYMADEGLYVMNVPYSYRRARLHAGGHEAAWFAVEWDAADLTWAAFMEKVVGTADPAAATDGSLRHHFHAYWTRYSLPGKPDAMESVLHASECPLAALAERCRWLGITPRQDPYGCLLLQSGVTPSLLDMLLANPSIYSRDTGSIAEAFHRLEQEDVGGLVRQLREEQCRCTKLLLPEGTRLVPPASATMVHPVPASAAAAAAGHGRDTASEVPKSLSQLEQLRVYRHVALDSAVDPFESCRFATAHREGHASSASFAVLYLNPTSVAMAADAPACLRTLRGMLAEQLSRLGVRTVQERVVRCVGAAEAAMLYRAQHHRQYRYGVAVPAAETLGESQLWQLRFKQRFGVLYQDDSVVLYNSAEMARVMQIGDAEVAALWHRSQSHYPTDFVVLGEGCVVQRLQPGKPFYLMNGAVTESEQQFVTAATAGAGVHVWLLAWDSARTDVSHAKLQQLLAELQSSTGVLRRCLTEAQAGDDAAGRVLASTSRDSAAPFLFVSESALAAVRQRHIWWQLPLWSDPTVAAWRTGDAITAAPAVDRLSPRAVAWALQDPLIAVTAREEGEPVHLWDVLIGMDATRTAARVRRFFDAAAAAEAAADARRTTATAVLPTRNTAVVVVSPQLASNRAVHRLVCDVLQENGVRIESQGFVADHGSGAALSQSLAQYLYPEDWTYATEEPANLALSETEAQAVADVFGAPWSALLAGGRLLPAARATKRLGGMTAAQLRLFVNGAKKALWVRSHLHIAELEEYGVYVINAHVSLTAHAITSTASQTPVPYYVVSFSPTTWAWKSWLEQVVGCAEPTLAVPSSIRGRLAASWSELGIHAAPERAEGGGGGVCVSEGPLQSLLCRLHIQWPPLDCLDSDVVGSHLQDAATVAVVRSWLANPTVTCDDVRVGVLTHLAAWDTREVLHLAEIVAASSSRSAPLLPPQLTAARHAEQEAVAWRAAEAVWAATFAQRFQLPRLLPPTAVDAGVSKGGDATDADLALLNRDVGTLLFFSHQLDAAQRARLRQLLEAHGVAVTATAKYEEGEQGCTAALLDRLCASDAFYADRHHIATALLGDGEVSAEDQARFNSIFRDDVSWQELLRCTLEEEKLDHPDASEGEAPHPGDADANVGGRRIYSAADAVKRWGLSPGALWLEARRGVSMQLTEGLVVTRLSPVVPRSRTEGDGAPYGVSSVEEEEEEEDEEEEAAPAPAAAAAAAAPWEGHYVVNAFYVALRAALCPPAAPADSDEDVPEESPNVAGSEFVLASLTKWNIAWDAGALSWQDLCQRVIGCADFSHAGVAAATDTFNATLAAAAAQEEASAAVAGEPQPEPSPLWSVGVMASSGPLAAFAVRRAWCWNADHHDVYLPDPLLRAIAVAGLDGTVIQKDCWLGNPITPATSHQRKQPCLRVFDWTRGCDTPAVLAWIRQRDQPLPPEAAVAAAEVPPAQAADEAEEEAAKSSQDATSVTALSLQAEGEEAEASVYRPPTPPPRMKTQLQAARVRDALLGARTEAELQQLWQHYRTLSDVTTSSASDAADASAAATQAPPTVSAAETSSTEGTIPFALFHRDFLSLDSFGVPCTSVKLKRLFLDIEVKKGGRMNYSEFTLALAFYHAM